MGIKFLCPQGHKLHVKSFLKGKRAICPKCGARVVVPSESTAGSDPTESVFIQTDDSETLEEPLELPNPPSTQTAAPAAAASKPGDTLTSPADPIDEEPSAVWYVRPATGGQFGPASGEIMRTWVDEGRVGAISLVWRAGWPEWRSAAATFPQLAGTLSGQAARSGPSQESPVVARPMASPTNGNLVSQSARVPVAQATPTLDLETLAAPVDLPATGAGLGQEIPVLPPGVHRRRRGKDANLMLSVVLLAISVILVVILMIVIWKNQTASDYGSDESSNPRDVSRDARLRASTIWC
jgi:GYF domain 2